MTSTLKINTIEPEGATTNLAIGESGQDVIVTGNDIRANVLQDAGGNAILTSNGSGTLSGIEFWTRIGKGINTITRQRVLTRQPYLLRTGIDSTYNEYVFEFVAIQSSLNTNGVEIQLYLPVQRWMVVTTMGFNQDWYIHFVRINTQRLTLDTGFGFSSWNL